MWLLLCIDYFTGRLEVSALEDLTTGSVSSAIQEVISSTGWNTRRISIDPGSSLITGVEATRVDVVAMQDQDNEHQHVLQTQVDDYEGQASTVINDLKEQGFEGKKPFAKNSWKQGKVESIIKSFKK